MRKGFLPILLALALVLALFPATALGADYEVDNVAELQAAVDNAADGDIIKIYPGDYNIQRISKTLPGGTTWYLPIYKSVTLVGVDAAGNEITDASQNQARLYSTDYTPNGDWSLQNLITILVDDVTISGLTIMNKVEPNKAIEVLEVESFLIKNCTFAPIAEDLLEGIDPSSIGGYDYDEYKEYGASLYFNGTKSALVRNNYFDYSNLTIAEATASDITVTGNTFEGIKNWNNDPDYQYSAIGYTSWASPPVTDITGSTLMIQRNKFIDTGKIKFQKATAGTVNLSYNYWGSEDPDFGELLVNNAAGSIVFILEPYFIREEMRRQDLNTYVPPKPGSIVGTTSTPPGGAPPPASLPFSDVSNGAWYQAAVEYVYENGLMNGIGNGLFGPELSTTRGMIVAILYRLEGMPGAPAAGFTDVPPGQYYTDAVAWAHTNGIVTGYSDLLFGPEDPITREQAAAILYRYAALKGYDTLALSNLSAYIDVADISDYASQAMAWADANSLLGGGNGLTLNPGDDASRAEVAFMLYGLYLLAAK